MAGMISEGIKCILHNYALPLCLMSVYCVHSATINYEINDSSFYMALRNEAEHIVPLNGSTHALQ